MPIRVQVSRHCAGAGFVAATRPDHDPILRTRQLRLGMTIDADHTTNGDLPTYSGAARMLPTDRIDYTAITERSPLRLPGNARVAVWVIVNVEEWDATQPMPRTVLTPPAGGSPSPDIPNWAWHEYRQSSSASGDCYGCSTTTTCPPCWRSMARRSRPIRRSCKPPSRGGGSSSATALPSAACRRCRTSAPTSFARARSLPRRPASRRVAGSGRG